MRKALKAAVAAITLGATALAAAVPAQAQSYRHDRRHHHDDNDVAGAAIAAGVLGLALGAAIGSSNRNDRYYDGRYYDRRYPDYRYSRSYRGYAQPYAYGYGRSYRMCEARRTVYDPYIGRRVVVRERFPC